MTLAVRYINPYIWWDNNSPIKYEYDFILYRKETNEILVRIPKKFKWEYLDAQLIQDGIDALNNYKVINPETREEELSTEEKDLNVVLDWMEGGPEE